MPARDEPRWLGPYQLLTQVGEGGMGVVHLALDDQGRAVAVKVMRSHLVGDAVGRARLAREVASMRMVLGPHVAEVLDANVDCPTPYVVMRYVPGRPLTEVVQDSGALSGRPLHQVALGLSRGLISIHIAGVVHRDLKPGNVLMADGQPVVIDFGLAQLADDQRLTTTGLLVGTPGFLAPEILAGRSGTAASDVHAWGATLAYAGTGRPPYGSGPIDVVLNRVLSREIDCDGLPPWLEGLVDRATDLEPRRRPTAQDLVTVLLDRVPAHSFAEPVRAQPTSSGHERPHNEERANGSATGSATRVLAVSPLTVTSLDKRSGEAPGSMPTGHPATRVGEPVGYATASPRTATWPLAEMLRPPAAPAAPVATAASTYADEVDGVHPVDSVATPAPLRSQPLAGALTVLALASVAALAPVLVALVGLSAVVLLRTVDVAARARARRAATYGPRRSDAAVSIAVAPWQLVRSALQTALLLPLALVAVAVVLVAGAVGQGVGLTAVAHVRWLDRSAGLAGRSTDVLLAAAALAALAVVTLGPGGSDVRAGYARVMSRWAVTGGVRVVYGGVALFTVALAALLSGPTAMSLWPWRP